MIRSEKSPFNVPLKESKQPRTPCILWEKHLEREIGKNPFTSYGEFRLKSEDMGMKVYRRTVTNYIIFPDFYSYSATLPPIY